MKVFTVVISHEGMVFDVFTFDSMDKAKEQFEKSTKVGYGSVYINETPYKESIIWESEVN